MVTTTCFTLTELILYRISQTRRHTHTHIHVRVLSKYIILSFCSLSVCLSVYLSICPSLSVSLSPPYIAYQNSHYFPPPIYSYVRILLFPLSLPPFQFLPSFHLPLNILFAHHKRTDISVSVLLSERICLHSICPVDLVKQFQRTTFTKMLRTESMYQMQLLRSSKKKSLTPRNIMALQFHSARASTCQLNLNH